MGLDKLKKEPKKFIEPHETVMWTFNQKRYSSDKISVVQWLSVFSIFPENGAEALLKKL